jgi:hypothetical protein
MAQSVLWARTAEGNVENLLLEMRSQVCLMSMLDGPPYGLVEQKALLYKEAQHRARLNCQAFGEFITHSHPLHSLMGFKDMWSWIAHRLTML